MTALERPVANIEALTHRYGAKLALDGVTVQIPNGCMVGLIGPDGVGKSSLLAIMAGARRIQTGCVQVLGRNIADAAERSTVCTQIAYLPQGLGKNLYPDLSVEENIAFFGRLFGHSRLERERRISELVASTGLAPFRDRPARKLSGGMRQKLGLCCALIHGPDFLILDEPQLPHRGCRASSRDELVLISFEHRFLRAAGTTLFSYSRENLTWIKFNASASGKQCVRTQRSGPMPIETIIVVACISIAFIGFGLVLAWADRQTGGARRNRGQ